MSPAALQGRQGRRGPTVGDTHSPAGVRLGPGGPTGRRKPLCCPVCGRPGAPGVVACPSLAAAMAAQWPGTDRLPGPRWSSEKCHGPCSPRWPGPLDARPSCVSLRCSLHSGVCAGDLMGFLHGKDGGQGCSLQAPPMPPTSPSLHEMLSRLDWTGLIQSSG